MRILSVGTAIAMALVSISGCDAGNGLDKVNGSVTVPAGAHANEARTVNGAIAVAKMMASKDARFDGMFNTLQASGTGSELEMSFTVPAELLDVVGRQGSPAAGTLQAQ